MITVAVVSHKHNELVNALVKQLADSNLISLIVVVENVRDMIQIDELAKVTLIPNTTPLGFGENNNIAARFLDEENHFLVINPDVMFPYDVGATLASLLEKIGDRRGVFSPNHVDERFSMVSSRREYLTIFGLIKRKIGINRIADNYWIPGAFMLFTPNIFQASLFDQRFFMYCEDMDICNRIRREGYHVGFIDNDFPIIHEGQRQSKKNLRHFILHITSLGRYFNKWMFSK